MAMQLPALGFEPAYKPVQIRRHFQRGRTGRALNAARPRDEDFEIVHAAEQVLCILQRTEASGFSGDVAELQRIPQLLDRDANLVQTVRKIKACGILDRRSEPPSP